MTNKNDILERIKKFPRSKYLIEVELDVGHTPEAMHSYIERGLERIHTKAENDSNKPEHELREEYDTLPSTNDLTCQEWIDENIEAYRELRTEMFRLQLLLATNGFDAYVEQLPDDSYMFSEGAEARMIERVSDRLVL